MEKIHKIDSNICKNLLHVFEERTIRDTSKCNYTDLDWQVHELTDQVFIIRAGKLAGEDFALDSCAELLRYADQQTGAGSPGDVEQRISLRL